MASARRADSGAAPALAGVFERLGRTTVGALEIVGFGATLCWDSAYWLLIGSRRNQRVRAAAVFAEAMEGGVAAIPIIAMLSLTIGLMLALQGVNALEAFGAEQQVVFGVALGVTREFAPLITGILVAGRSGSALAARLATMIINEEVDALRVMGINPVRFLVAPSLLAMAIMVPALALMADLVGLLGAGVYIVPAIDITPAGYLEQTIQSISIDDVLHGLTKSIVFGVLIATIAISQGSAVRGGAEGVGRVTTNAVVQSISAIVVTDMIFVYIATL